MRSHGLGIGHQAVRGSLDNHDQPVEGMPVTPTVNSASVIDLRAYADPSVVPTLVLVDLQKEYITAPRILALPHAPQALDNCRIALTHARTKGFPVAFVRWLGRSALFNRATPFSGWIEGFEPTGADMVFERDRPFEPQFRRSDGRLRQQFRPRRLRGRIRLLGDRH